MKSSLNKSQVEDLLINVLRSPKVMPWKGSKIQFCCPVHGESHPSAGIDIDFNTEDSPDGHFQVFHCFEGNTKIITDKGVFAIKDLVGSECSIINGNGEWETTKFKSFGKQQLYKLVLTSNGHEKIIYTTSQHRWFVQKRSSTVFTQDLKVGQRLQRQWLKAPKSFSLNREGLIHGFLFGDGTLNKNVHTRTGMYNHSAKICGDMKYHFCKSLGIDIRPIKDPSNEVKGVFHYTCPYNAKEIPVTDDLDYILSFLAGYFVADGNCTHQSISLSSSSEEVMHHIKCLCTLVGIATYPISVQVRNSDSNMGIVTLNQEHRQYSIKLVKSTIPECFWVSEKKPVHTAKYSSYLGYTVKSVTPTLIWSDVYCCETSTHSFVLDGFILTGNCFSCGESGTIPWLVYKSLPDRFSSVKQAADFLKKRYDVSYEYTADRKTGKIKRYDEPEEEIAHKRHELPKSFIAPFKSGKETYQYFFDRGFDKNDMKQFLIGRDLESETVTIPVFWEDDTLAGVIGRYIDKNRPKNMRYKIYNFPKGDLIFPLNKLQVINNTIIGVEGMLDVIKLHKWGYPNAVAMMGDGMSKKQADLIADRCGVFIDLFDHDKGGETARKIARKRLGNRVVYLTPSYYPEKGKDPSEWGEIETVKVIKSASYLGDKIIPRL